MKRQSGVTLIELLVVIMVVGILAAIAYPSYRAQVMRSHRSDAKVALERYAQSLERCFTNSAPKGYAACPAPTATSDNGYYAITRTIPAAPNDQTFLLTATAVGGQLQDTDCRTFTLNSVNARVARTAAAADNSAQCWRR
jgi:type IV pilus assembly protein PilE